MRTARAVPTPFSCRNTMISRMTFWSAQAAAILAARLGPMPPTSRSRPGSASMMSKTAVPNCLTRRFA
jgi:hypothetical protein